MGTEGPEGESAEIGDLSSSVGVEAHLLPCGCAEVPWEVGTGGVAFGEAAHDEVCFCCFFVFAGEADVEEFDCGSRGHGV